MRPAVVIWGDAWEETGASSLDDWKHEPYVTHCCGWVIRDDETGITLCQEWWPRDPGKVRHATFIPRGMVRRVQYLGRPPRRKEP